MAATLSYRTLVDDCGPGKGLGGGRGAGGGGMGLIPERLLGRELRVSADRVYRTVNFSVVL